MYLKMSNVVLEYGKIKSGDSRNSNPNECYIPLKAFNYLKAFVLEENVFSDEVGKIFKYSKKRGIEYITAQNYVGIIETRDGTLIEILPKIHFNSFPNDEELINETRLRFLKMLKHLKDAPFKNIDEAHIKTKRFPLIEIFITSFLDEFEQLLKKGFKQSYKAIEANSTYFKGRLLVTENIRENLVDKSRFYVQFDDYLFDIPQNRIIKSTLDFLRARTNSTKNRSRITNYLNILEEIPASKNFTKDFNSITSQNRLFSHYTRLLLWAKVFLLGNSFTTYKGNSINKAILFPMERIFEDYVSFGLKKYVSEYRVSIQEEKYFLVDEHIGNTKFKLKPDNILRNDDKLIILDTKWKLINETKPKENYGITSNDMYQLYAYADKYFRNEQIDVRLFLLYPQYENFNNPLKEFVYNKVFSDNIVSNEIEDKFSQRIILNVLPVRLDCSLKDCISELAINSF